MTGLVKVFEIERVVPHLIDGSAAKVILSDFKFDDEDD